MKDLDRNLSCEEVDSDDLDGELNLSDCEDGTGKRGAFKMERRTKKSRAANKYVVEVDTNIMKVPLSVLKNVSEVASGDPELCKACQAVFNKDSVLKPIMGKEDQVWLCEFCNTENTVFIDQEEIPKALEVNYLVEAAAQVMDKKLGGSQDISNIFCMDISGSMCVSEAIDGKHNILGDNKEQLKGMMRFGDGSDQFLDQAEKNKTYISRIQCLKAAICAQIDEMAKGADKRKVGVVTFNHEVTMIGDGSKDPQVITGDKLMDYDFLENNGKTEGASRLEKNIGETAKILK